MRAPELMVGDGALGLWAALRTVWPQTRNQLCWVHKTARGVSALPKRAEAGRQAAAPRHQLRRVAHRRAAGRQVLADKLADQPKAVAKITRDLDALTAFFDFPAQFHKHLRSTNPIESTLATVRLRTRVTRGAGSRDAAIAMACKLLRRRPALATRRRPELVPLVRAGATFIDGQLVEREDTQTEVEQQDNDQERAA